MFATLASFHEGGIQNWYGDKFPALNAGVWFGVGLKIT
jgi:hypothetical protein